VIPDAPHLRRPFVQGRSTVFAPEAAVATSHPLASTAALDVLRSGGNAWDAAVVAAAVLTVVEPHMTGVGGDAFALSWVAGENRVEALRSSGRAGALATPARLQSRGFDEVPLRGAEAVTVPGALAGWEALLTRRGTLSLGEALSPAIALASTGFPVSPIVAEDWAHFGPTHLVEAAARSTYLVASGLTEGRPPANERVPLRAPRAGEWHRNPDLAETYRLIAARGTRTLYGGALGAQIVSGLAHLGGLVTLEDLATHQAEWITPIHVPFRGHRIYQLPPPNQGVAALQMLQMLERTDLLNRADRMERSDLLDLVPRGAAYVHLLIELKKLAFADLAAHVGDPDRMQRKVRELLDPRYLDTRRREVNPSVAAEHPEPGRFMTDADTICLAVADGQGNMVSFIQSLFAPFGAGVVIPETGVLLQNRGAGFTLKPGRPNTLAPGARPFHTLLPGLATRTHDDGTESPWLAYGVMGGPFQPQGHVQLLMNLLYDSMDLQQAVDAPRFAHIGGLHVSLEPGFDHEVETALAAFGHTITPSGRDAFGGAQAVMRLDQGWAAASDPRKDGQAQGH